MHNYIFDKDYCLNLIKMICVQHNIEYKFLSQRQNKKYKLKHNSSYVFLNNPPKIIFSIYEGHNWIQRLMLSFFHELMHILNNIQNCSRLELQLNITVLAIKYAREKYKIYFSNETIQWIINQHFAYSNSKYNFIQLRHSNDNQYQISLNF